MSTRVFRRRVTAPTPLSPSNKHPSTFPLGKNLRWTAVALAAKLSADHERPSAEVADEIALSAAADLRRLNPHRDAAAVERNTRRRVYDALKVMVAAGCVQREGKALRWIGVDDLTPNVPLVAQEEPSLRVQLCQARRSIARKRALATELQARIAAFNRLVKSHSNDHDAGLPPSSTRIHFPMVVVNARAPQVSYDSDRRRVKLTTPHPFKVYSESDVVLMMSERRRPRSQTLQKKPRAPSKLKPASRSVLDRRRVPLSPPPPPPPSPEVLNKEEELRPFALSHLHVGQPQCRIDLKQLQVLARVHQDEIDVESAGNDGADVGDTTEDFSAIDPTKAELCLDPEIPVQYEQDDDDKGLFEHMRKSPVPPVPPPPSIFEHDLDSRESAANSIGTSIPNTQFEHLPDRRSAEEHFAPEVDLICDEELSDPIAAGDTTESERVHGFCNVTDSAAMGNVESTQDSEKRKESVDGDD